jgi:hypothetical protein
VSRRMPELLLSETKIFYNLDDARKQLDEWLE